MYIEYAGLPGSGKSTTYGTTVRVLKANAKHYANFGNIESYFDDVAKIPKFVSRRESSRAIYRTEQYRLQNPALSNIADRIFEDDLIFKSLFTTCAGHYYIYRAVEERVPYGLFDEGLVHRGIHAITKHHKKNSGLLKEFAEALPKIDILVFCQLDAERAYQRTVERLFGRLGDKRSEKEVQTKVNRFHGNLKTFQIRQQAIEYVASILDARGSEILVVNTEVESVSNYEFTQTLLEHSLIT